MSYIYIFFTIIKIVSTVSKMHWKYTKKTVTGPSKGLVLYIYDPSIKKKTSISVFKNYNNM